MSNINILYEDNHIIVVLKKENIPVQKDSSNDLDMLTIIKNYIKEKYNKPGNVYLGLVHRLDRPVGGIMVFAKTSKAASRLSKMIRENEFHKEYLSLVHGKMKKNGELINYLSKDNKTNNAYIDDEKGKYSKLIYKNLYYDDKNDLSLLKINLITGRHHQIRFQLSNINHPIYGDQRYGYQDKKQIKLFAYKIKFIHPVKKEEMEFCVLPNWKIVNEVKL